MLPLTIQLVSNHRLTLAGLRAILANDPMFSVVVDSGIGSPALRNVRSHRPQLVLVHVDGEEPGYLELIRQIRREHRGLALVILSAKQQHLQVREAFLAGASAYLSKDITQSEFKATLLDVHRKGRVIPAHLAQHLLDLALGNGGKTGDPLSALTTRERDVLLLLLDEHATDEIGSLLNISAKTVRNHLSGVYAKLGTNNRVRTIFHCRRLLAAGTDNASGLASLDRYQIRSPP